MAARNPFSPTFGTSPPVLAGRDDILDSVGDALATGPTHPDYTALFIGVRGAGKTVMLNAVEDVARSRGWLALSDNASSVGLPDRLTRAASDFLAGLGPTEPKRRLSSVTAAGIGVGFETVPTPEAEYDLRKALSGLGDALAERGTGLLMTVDEMQSGDVEEIREFGSVLQHVSRRELDSTVGRQTPARRTSPSSTSRRVSPRLSGASGGWFFPPRGRRCRTWTGGSSARWLTTTVSRSSQTSPTASASPPAMPACTGTDSYVNGQWDLPGGGQ